MNNTDDFQFRFIRDENRFPAVGLATRIDRSNNEIAYGYCVVHPKDRGNFDRKLAHTIAEGRLEVSPIIIQAPIPENTHEITKLVLTDMLNYNEPPKGQDTVLKRAIRLWLEKHQQAITGVV